MILRLIVLLFGIGALLAQFLLGVYEDRAKQRENETLQAKLKRIEGGVNELVSQGKLTASDARRLLVIEETLHFEENLQIERKTSE